MNPETIRERISLLYTALMYCADVKTTFTVTDRIMINQERARWMQILDNPLAEPRIISPQIENKLKKIAGIIANYDQEQLATNFLKNE